jgi:hypothetical protein
MLMLCVMQGVTAELITPQPTTDKIQRVPLNIPGVDRPVHHCSYKATESEKNRDDLFGISCFRSLVERDMR